MMQPKKTRGELLALGHILSDRMYEQALAAIDRLDAIDADFPDEPTDTEGEVR